MRAWWGVSILVGLAGGCAKASEAPRSVPANAAPTAGSAAPTRERGAASGSAATGGAEGDVDPRCVTECVARRAQEAMGAEEIERQCRAGCTLSR